MNLRLLSVFFVTFLAIGCNSRKLSVRGGIRTSTDPTNSECTIQASIALESTNANDLVVNRAIRFRVTASGCSNGYFLYVNGLSDTPIEFSDTTSYTRVYPSAQVDIRDSVFIAVLGGDHKPIVNYNLTSSTFTIRERVLPVNCLLAPIITNITIPVDQYDRPILQAPPNVSFNISSDVPTRVMALQAPEQNGVLVSSSTPIPSGVASAHSISAKLLAPRSGAYEFTVQDGSGNSNQCAADIRVTLDKVTEVTYPRVYFVGDVTGGGISDVVTMDNDGTVWVAAFTPSRTFTYKRFGTFPLASVVDILFQDFNHDGIFDLIGRVQSTRMWKAAFSDGNQFNVSDLGAWSADKVLSDIGVADINADGKPDVVGKLNGVNYVSYLTVAAGAMTGTIADPIPLPAVMRLEASSLTPAFNDPVNISWSTENVVSCNLLMNGITAPGLPAGENRSGNFPILGIQTDASFQISCIQAGSNATVTSNVVQVVVGAPDSGNFLLYVKVAPNDNAANASIVDSGGTVSLRGQSPAGYSACRLFQGIPGTDVNPTFAYLNSAAITENRIFKLQCMNAGANVSTPDQVVKVVSSLTFDTVGTTIDFGSVDYGSQSASERSVKITSILNHADTSNIRVTFPEGFVWTSGCGMTSATSAFNLAENANCTIKFRFKPVKVVGAVTHPSPYVFTSPLNITYFNGRVDVVNAPAATLKGTAQDAPAGGK